MDFEAEEDTLSGIPLLHGSNSPVSLDESSVAGEVSKALGTQIDSGTKKIVAMASK